MAMPLQPLREDMPLVDHFPVPTNQPSTPYHEKGLGALDLESSTPSASSTHLPGNPTYSTRASMVVEKKMSPAKMQNILKTLGFFEDMSQSVKSQLPLISSYLSYPQNTVLFRQGDPPGNCYVILSGSVAVHAKSWQYDDPEEDEEEEEPIRPDSAFLAPTDPNLLGSPQERLDSMRAALDESRRSMLDGKDQDFSSSLPGSRSPSKDGGSRRGSLKTPEGGPIRFSTAEGFSSYSKRSDFGKAARAPLGPGNIIGELALLQKQGRSATLKCVTDAEFLVIRAKEFEQVLKEEFEREHQRKVQFLREHVPGMREMKVNTSAGKAHPSYFFKKGIYGRGYQFLVQGTVAEDTIFVVAKGAVEFVRHEAQQSQPVGACGAPGLLRKRERNFRRSTPVLPGLVEVAKSKAYSEDDAGSEGVTKKVGRLLEGGIFGPLPGLSGPEPFTVVAISSPCEVLSVSMNDLPKLPRSLVSFVQDYIAGATTWRLEQLRNGRSIEVPKSSNTARMRLPAMSVNTQERGIRLVTSGKLHTHPVLFRSQSAATVSSPNKARTATGDGLGSPISSPGVSTMETVPSLTGGSSTFSN